MTDEKRNPTTPPREASAPPRQTGHPTESEAAAGTMSPNLDPEDVHDTPQPPRSGAGAPPPKSGEDTTASRASQRPLDAVTDPKHKTAPKADSPVKSGMIWGVVAVIVLLVVVFIVL
ncbi:hypothetical protein RM543_07665 [Roseicyclus sp. F158]|uniref:Uncharacterized protein n=1 Tax=Tropicimonas omnivorans TaxID=3075590 RepID=A0ABU3DHA8_9RHOB|nr:hypothetical protein [Roseicyclus sp. F158]MDT0682557.1 hypothetical protein [Roseicyclus sp. F158]